MQIIFTPQNWAYSCSIFKCDLLIILAFGLVIFVFFSFVVSSFFHTYNETEEKSYPKNRRRIDKNKGSSSKKPQEEIENLEENSEKVDQKSSSSEKTKQTSNAKRKRTSKHKKKITKKDTGKTDNSKEKTTSDENTVEPEAS